MDGCLNPALDVLGVFNVVRILWLAGQCQASGRRSAAVWWRPTSLIQRVPVNTLPTLQF